MLNKFLIASIGLAFLCITLADEVLTSKEGGEGEEKKSEQEEVTEASNLSSAIMLMGGIAFQMVLYYLVNWPDKDIQYYSYNIISQSIAIFSAVLGYSAFNNCLRFYLLPHMGEHGSLILQGCHFLAWFIFVQFLCAYISGSMDSEELPEPKDAKSEEAREELEAKWHQRELAERCWGTLIAHVTSFAALGFFVELQQLSFFKSSPGMAVLAIPAGFLITALLSHISDTIRYRIALAGDGQISRSEELWDEQAEEIENDIFGLSLGFLALQSIRFGITGKLPELAGETDANFENVNVGLFGPTAPKSALILGCVALGMIVLTTIFGYLFNKLYAHRNSYEGLDKRALMVSLRFVSMLSAWSLLYSSKAVAWMYLSDMPEMLETVSVALFVSTISFAAIFVLDKIADQSKGRDDLWEVIFCLITSFGMLVGIGWEATFDEGIETICGESALLNFNFSMLICLVVVPANYLYIIPAVEKAKHIAHLEKSESLKELEETVESDEDSSDETYGQEASGLFSARAVQLFGR